MLTASEAIGAVGPLLLYSSSIMKYLIVFACLLVATTAESLGDATIRIGLFEKTGAARVAAILGGAVLLLVYGLMLNLAPLPFARIVGCYIATLFLVWQLVAFFTFRLRQERNRAVSEAARTRTIRNFMKDLLSGNDNEYGPAEGLTVSTVLNRGVENARMLVGTKAIATLSTGSPGLFLGASALTGIGFGVAFMGAMRLISTVAPPQQRASVM